MASNPTLLLALAWALFPLILFLFPISIESRSTPLSNHPKRGPHHQLHQQPFEFTKKLKGCNKGDTIKDLHLLKRYLEKFGYIPNHSEGIDNDSFYDLLESAVKSYQYNFHLNITGQLDAATADQMMIPRCGVADVVDEKSGKVHHLGSTNLYATSQYSFFPNSPR